MTDHSEMLTMREVCEFFGGSDRPLDQSTIYRWVRNGRLPPPLRIGSLRRWRRADLQRALDAMQGDGP